jgi:hypothetical protein
LGATVHPLVWHLRDFQDHSDRGPGVLSYSDYRKLGPKENCPSEHAALIVAGDLDDDGLGDTIRICTDKGCKVHGARAGSVYKATPKEIAARKAAVAREEAKKKREFNTVVAAVKKVKLPLGTKAIDALMEIAIREVREDGIRMLIRGEDWDVLRVKTTYSTKPQLSYEATLRAKVKTMKYEEKNRIGFDMFLLGNLNRSKIMKML